MKSNKNNLSKKKSIKKRKISQDLPKIDQKHEESFQEESVEIIKLTEDTDEENENNSDWIDVPELPVENGIIINFENTKVTNKLNDEKRQQQRIEREFVLLKDRTMLLCLLARVFYINKLCNEDLIQNLAFSLFPYSFMNRSVLS